MSRKRSLSQFNGTMGSPSTSKRSRIPMSSLMAHAARSPEYTGFGHNPKFSCKRSFDQFMGDDTMDDETNYPKRTKFVENFLIEVEAEAVSPPRGDGIELNVHNDAGSTAADNGTSKKSKPVALFTFEQVKAITDSFLQKYERKIRDDYDKILEHHLAEQHNRLVSYAYQKLQQNMSPSDALDYIS